MENKYYTPTLEEFHVGFEFEMDDTWGGWKKLTLTEELLKHPMVGLGSGNERAPYYHKTRVKHLDKEDIASLGWVKYGNNFIIKGEDCYTLYPYKDGGYGIMKVTWSLFQGNIKNKSELKKLMNQLGIIKNENDERNIQVERQ